METERPYKKKKKKKAQRSLAAGVGLAALAIFSLVFLGMKIEQRNYQEPLPANQSCLQALDLSSKALQGEAVDLAAAVKACRDNVTKYEVTAK